MPSPSRGPGRIRRDVVALLAATLCLASCGEGAAPAPSHLPESPAPVYRAVLGIIAASDAETSELVIQRETEVPASLLEALGEDTVGRFAAIHRQQLVDLEEQTERAFWNNNGQSEEIDDGVLPAKSARWLSRADFDDVLRAPDGWETFFAQNPRSGGVVRLSRVGFGEGGNQALVHYSRACPLCARSEYILLQRQDTLWQVVARSLDTVS